MKKLLCILPLIALCCAGCVGLTVPRTTISGVINGQPFSVSSPKDSKLNGLEIVSQSGGLTNFVAVRIQSVETRMNPEVISTTADAEVKMIQAVGSEIRSAAASAATAAAK